MTYPASLDELTDGVPSDVDAPSTAMNDATYPHDDHHRALAVAVEAVEAELGTDPSGSEATVKARIAATEAVANAAAVKASNLSDLTSAATARTNLGLGGAATLAVGTTAGTVAAGDDSRITGAVPKSTVTTAGDLIYGTGNAAVSRLGIGTALQVLRTNAGATAPEWATVSSGGIQPTSAVVGGNYYPIYPTGFEGNTSQAITATTLQMFQWVVQQDCTVTELWIDVTSGGGAGKKASVGIYTASTTWVPSLLLDAGQLDVASTGIKKATSLGRTLTAGQYWLAVHAEANMSLRTVYGGMSHAAGSTGTLNGAATWATTATFGSLPASPTPAITNTAHEWNMVFPVVTR